MTLEALEAAITEADNLGNLEFAATLRALRGDAARIQAESGEHEGARWTSAKPGLSRDQVYPANTAHRWRGDPAFAVEFGGNGDIVLIDPWNGDSLRVDAVYDPDGLTPFLVGLRRALDVAEATGWFDGRSQVGRAGVVRE